MIEQYRDELETQIRGTTDDQHNADDREAVASDLLNILHKSVLMAPLMKLIPITLLAYPYNPLPPMGRLWYAK